MTNIYQKLIKVQQNAPKIIKDSDNPYFHSKYASLDSVLEPVIPLLNENSLFLTQLVTTKDNQPALCTKIIDIDTKEEISSTMYLMTKSSDPQAQGSSITYAKRYALQSMLGLQTGEDDDGNAATPIPADKAMTKTQWSALGKLLDEKGISDRDDKIKLVQTLSNGKPLNTSAYQRLEKEIAEAAPDTLQNILMGEF
jgi:hypothetical protein